MWILTPVLGIMGCAMAMMMLLGLFKGGKDDSTFRVHISGGWELRNSNRSVTVPARLPTTVHTSLLAAKVVTGDPFYRYNELTFAWVALEEWKYVLNVASDTNMYNILKKHKDGNGLTHLMLRFGHNTGYSVVSLANDEIGIIRNEFISHDFVISADIAKLCCDNIAKGQLCELAVSLFPPLGTARALAQQSTYPVPAVKFYNTWTEPSYRNFLRKPQSDFGWDWGPAFLPVGIGELELILVQADGPEPTTKGLLGNVMVTQQYDMQANDWAAAVSLAVTIEIDLYQETAATIAPARVDFNLTQPDGKVVAQASHACSASSQVSVQLDVSQPLLWYPTGYGDQPLYTLYVSFEGQVVSKRIGLRHVELAQEPTDGGSTFYIKVNGLPIFAKGANVVPIDVFSDRVTDERVRELVTSAYQANMNMLRVWGGGGRLPVSFYDMCDELGILIWQEMYYACALYPVAPDNLRMAWSEAVTIVKELHAHPSIVMWGGNNEVEQAFSWFDESRNEPGRRKYEGDYEALFIQTIKAAVMSIAYDVPFVHSSPSNGGDLVPGEDPSDLTRGDLHFYNYGMDCEDPRGYPLSRFISEHGVQSHASAVSYASVSEAADRSRDSPLLAWRLRHEGGLVEMDRQMKRHFKDIPNDDVGVSSVSGKQQSSVGKGSDSSNTFAMYLHLTQVQQGRCLTEAISAWRRNARADGGGTMGVLYWQLNDVWPGAPSWSTLEHDGFWKPSHFAVKRAFEPLIVSSTRESGAGLGVSLGGVDGQEVPAGDAADSSTAAAELVSFHVSADWSLGLPSSASASPPLPITGTYYAGLHSWGQADCEVVRKWEGDFSIAYGGGTALVLTIDVDDVRQQQQGQTEPFEGGYIKMVVETSQFTSSTIAVVGAATAADNIGDGGGASPNSLRDVELVDPQIELVRAELIDAGQQGLQQPQQQQQQVAQLVLRSSRAAPHVYIDMSLVGVRGRLSDNDFFMLPCEEKTVTFTSFSPVSVDSLLKNVRVFSLYDVQRSGSGKGVSRKR